MAIADRIDAGVVQSIVAVAGESGNVTGAAFEKDSVYSTFQAIVETTAGNGTATVTIQCSNDGVNWCATALGVITLSGASGSSDGFTTQAPWKKVRAVLSNVTGTGVKVKVLMGY